MKFTRAIAATAIGLALLVASGAQAAQRYAAPQGGGVECSQGAPCSLTESIRKAQSGDEVIVGAGTYTVVEWLVPEGAENVDIHGDYGAPMPTVKAAFPGPVIGNGVNGRTAYLEVDNLADSAAGFQCVYGTIERVRSRVVGNNSVALDAIGPCLTRDSLLIASGTKSIALVAAGFEDGLVGRARNLTAIAGGAESVGISAEYGPAPPGRYTIEIKNTIAEGAAADLRAAEGTSGFGDIVISNSNFDRPKQDGGAKLTDAGGNQAVAPLFVDAAGGNYLELRGSPTIDAGVVDDQLGALDLDGNARVLGTAVDIGAYEFVGKLRSLAVKPKSFRAGKVAGAVASRGKEGPARRGAVVSFRLSASAAVEFHVERTATGRRVGGKCVRKTHGNNGRGKCVIHKPLKGRFSVPGVKGANRFKFSGRVRGRALKPGPYRLVGKVGSTTRRAIFTIVR